MALSEVVQPILSDPQLLSDTQKIFLGELGVKKRKRLPGSPSSGILALATATALGWYGYDTFVNGPVCTSGTPVEVTNPTSSALKGEFESKGCQVLGGEKMVTLSRPTGEQYAAPRKNVRAVQ